MAKLRDMFYTSQNKLKKLGVKIGNFVKVVTTSYNWARSAFKRGKVIAKTNKINKNDPAAIERAIKDMLKQVQKKVKGGDEGLVIEIKNGEFINFFDGSITQQVKDFVDATPKIAGWAYITIKTPGGKKRIQVFGGSHKNLFDENSWGYTKEKTGPYGKKLPDDGKVPDGDAKPPVIPDKNLKYWIKWGSGHIISSIYKALMWPLPAVDLVASGGFNIGKMVAGWVGKGKNWPSYPFSKNNFLQIGMKEAS